MYEKINVSKDSEKETKSNTWIEKEPIKNRKEKNKTKSEKWTALNAEHRIGTNHMTDKQRQKSVQIEEKLATTQGNADRNKVRTEE